MIPLGKSVAQDHHPAEDSGGDGQEQKHSKDCSLLPSKHIFDRGAGRADYSWADKQPGDFWLWRYAMDLFHTDKK